MPKPAEPAGSEVPKVLEGPRDDPPNEPGPEGPEGPKEPEDPQECPLNEPGPEGPEGPLEGPADDGPKDGLTPIGPLLMMGPPIGSGAL